jgi:hypothetical protein
MFLVEAEVKGGHSAEEVLKPGWSGCRTEESEEEEERG